MKLSIGKKLAISFFIVMLFMGIVGWNGISKMSTINEKTTEIVTSWMPGVESINNINYLTEHVLVTNVKMIVDPNEANLQAYQQQNEKTLEIIDNEFAKYEKTIYLEEDRRNFDELKNYWNEYKKTNRGFIDISSEVDIIKGAGANTEKLATLLKESERLFQKMQQPLNFLVKLNHDGAVKAGEESKEIYSSGQLVTMIIFGVSLILSIVLAVVITRMISLPVQKVSHSLEQLSSGNLALDDLHVKNRDEIGALAASFNQMKTNLRQLIRQVSEGAEQVAASSEELLASTEEVTSGASEVAQHIQELASGSTAAAQTSNDTSRGMEEAALGIQRIAESTSSVSEAAIETTKEADSGNRAIHSVVAQMNKISETVGIAANLVKDLGKQSEEIGNITKVITDITSQTNLLALNAAIEAARAGEHGRGFAVVADEVRKLAEQSKESAIQITNLIQQIQTGTGQVIESMERGTEEVNTGVSLIEDAGVSFGRILSSIQHVTSQIQEISAASEELSASVQEVTASVEDVAETAKHASEISQSIAASTEEQLASMEEISGVAESLSKMAQGLNDEVRKFQL
ncbi:methyl-accepting chemotaxis protein [Brevibacillus sp. SYSU BS000544]|uniref:methyl-accepting chemotaxis protein n=1 Tax=Brevibacillus sp. SYSU BS000544 TaxID=3416443 RepID=UPI003CE59C7B